MIKLFGITIFTIVLLSAIAGVNPAQVLVMLIETPLIQVLFILSSTVAFVFWAFRKLGY